MTKAEEMIEAVVGGEHTPADVFEQEKWIAGAIKEPGALRKQMGIKDPEKTIPATKLTQTIKKLKKKGAAGEKKLTAPESKKLKRAVMAKTLHQGFNK